MSVLSLYNQRTMYKEELFDSKFIYFLALEVLTKERIIRDDIQPNRINFAKRIFEIRLKDQCRSAERYERFNTLLINRINEIKARYNEQEKQLIEINRMQHQN